MESATIEKHKGYYGCGCAGGSGGADGTGDGSGSSDGHGRNYTQDLNEFEIPETGYGRGEGHGGGGGGDSHGQIFNADLESDIQTTRADFYEGDGDGYGYGYDYRYCYDSGVRDECGGEGYVSSRGFKKSRYQRRYDLGSLSGSGTEDGRGVGYPSIMPPDLYWKILKKDSFLGWLRRTLGL